jgi:Asp-tRNA(Asn)/Glu-tRNA(Gln) amidotransferase A subunit family amidase
MNLPWTHAGLPVVALPATRIAPGLPFAVQLATPWGEDERLFAFAAAVAPAFGEPWPAAPAPGAGAPEVLPA